MKNSIDKADIISWNNLSSAYGNNDDIIENILKLHRENDTIKWLVILEDDLFGENQIIHQDSFYQMTVAVMPHLVDMLMYKNLDYITKCKAFTMIGYANNCEDVDVVDSVSQEMQSLYRDSVVHLKTIALDLIENGSIVYQPTDKCETNFFISSLIGVVLDKKMGVVFVRAITDEIEFECNQCGQGYLYLSSEYECDGIENIIVNTQNTQDKEYVWIYELLKKIPSNSFSTLIPYFFGEYTCPDCGNKVRTIDLG